jgi:hypothetical protein
MAPPPARALSKVLPSAVEGCAYYLQHASTSKPSPPLVLLMGWYASTPKQVQKYAQHYNALGSPTLHLTLPHEAVFGKRTRELQDAICGELEALVKDPATPLPEHSSVVVHAFSNGGVFGLLQVLPSTTPALFSKLSGVIYDSAPCYLHAISGARAFSYGLAQGEMARSLITALLVPVFVVRGAVGFVASGGVNFQNEFWERCVQ